MRSSATLSIAAAILFFSTPLYAADCDRYAGATQAMHRNDLACLEQFVTTADEANAFVGDIPISFSSIVFPELSDGLLLHLLKTGLDPNQQSNRGKTSGSLLSWTITAGRPNAVDNLIEFGADVELGYGSSLNDWWPLRTAVVSRQESIVSKLIRAGADVNRKSTTTGQSLLLTAIGAKHPQIASLLLQAGADVEAEDAQGDWPLMRAAKVGSVELVKLLVEHGANLERKSIDYFGWTALHAAVAYGKGDAVSLLLALGANPIATDNRGRTVEERALRKGMSHLFSG